MAASITFDFLTKGADRTASDFRKVGDNTVLAARGARVLSDAIEKLGKKEGRTAEESVLLAKALRQTGDAEDRVTARAVLADAAIRRLGDAMSDTSKQTGKAKGEVTGLAKAVEGLKGKGGPAWLGPALLALPALGTLSGVVAGAAAGIGGAFLAGGTALAAFGAVAKPVLSDAKKAAGAVEKAQQTYNAAIAGGTKHSVAYKAEQIAIAKAYAGMSPAQVALSRQLGGMADAWDAVKKAQTPVVAGALQPWLKSVTALTGNLGPVIAKIAPVIQGLGTQFGNLVNSAAFRGFRDFIGATGAAAVSAGGSTIIDLVKSFMILLPQFDPLIREAVGWISRLGPAVLKWSSSKKASDDIQKFLQWFSQNGSTVATFIGSVGRALGALLPGLTHGGLIELAVLKNLFNWIGNLPKGIAGPLTEVAGALLVLNKIPGGNKVITFGVNLVGKGAGVLLKLLGLGGVARKLGLDIGSAGMQRAGDTMVTAAGLMQKAADTMVGADVAGAGGAGGAAGKAGKLGKLGGLAGLGGLGVGIGVLGGLGIAALVDPSRKFDKPPPPGVTHPRGFQAPPSQAWKTWAKDVTIANAIAKDAVNAATATIAGDFTKQRKAAGAAGHDLDVYTQSIRDNGAGSLATLPARAQLVADMEAAGVKSSVARGDVDAYTGAVAKNGTDSAKGLAARSRLIADILAVSGNARQGQADLAAFTSVVKNHSSSSDAVRGARQRLIQDLVNGGTDAKTASGLVDGLQSSINKLHGKTVPVNVTASGTGQIFITGAGWAAGQGNIRFHAAKGMFVRDGSGPTADDVPAMLSKGEVVVPTHMVKAGAVDHLRGLVPGFAAGGFVGLENQLAAAPPQAGTITGNLAGQAVHTGVNQAMTKAHAQVAAKAAAAQSALGFALIPGGGKVSGSAAAAQAWAHAQLASGIYGWGLSNWPALQALWMGESGWRWDAYNAGSGATGIPQALPGSKMASAGADWRTNPVTQMRWGLAYIRSVYGSPSTAYSRWLARSPHWYSGGGLVDGYASGGLVGRQGAAYLRAWQDRHGGGYGAAWGPVTVNRQIDSASAALTRNTTLAHASLPPAQHRHYVGAAAWWKRHRDALVHERGVMRDWRGQLGGSDHALSSWIAAAGSNKALAPSVRRWKGQRAHQEHEIAAISRALGWSAAQQAAIDKARPKHKPPVPTGVQAKHTYGGDVTDTIGAFLASVAAPFGAARGGLVMDRGGWLQPGWNATYNATGRPEHLVPSRGGGGDGVHLHLTVNGPIGSPQQLEDWFIRTANKTAQHGRLTQAVRAAAR